MDPVYILHMDSEHRETVVCLFQGGTVLFDTSTSTMPRRSTVALPRWAANMTSLAYSPASPNAYSKDDRYADVPARIHTVPDESGRSCRRDDTPQVMA